jgi:hypothetical protein
MDKEAIKPWAEAVILFMCVCLVCIAVAQFKEARYANAVISTFLAVFSIKNYHTLK